MVLEIERIGKMQTHTSFTAVLTPVSHSSEQERISWNTPRIAMAGLTAGAVYGGAVIVSGSFDQQELTLVPMLKWVTTGMFGTSGSLTDEAAAVVGLLGHLFLSILFAAGYGAILAVLPVPRGSEVVAGLAYGALVGVVMAGVVFHLAHVQIDLRE